MQAKLIWGVWSVAVAFFTVIGLWAFIDPASFFDNIANFPPYNRHFLRDSGAFQLGVAGALIAGAFLRDALLVALSAAAAGSVFHALSHVIDRDLGGDAGDHVFLWALAVALVAAAVARARGRRE